MKVDIPALNIKGLDIPELAYLELTPQNVMRILFACRVTEEVEGKSIETVSFISSKSAGRQVPTVKFDVKKRGKNSASNLLAFFKRSHYNILFLKNKDFFKIFLLFI